MNIPEYTVHIVSQSCDSLSRKRLVRFLFTGSWLDTVPIPRNAIQAESTTTRLAYADAFVNIIEQNAYTATPPESPAIYYGDFTAAHGIKTGLYYDKKITYELHEKEGWLVQNQSKYITVWALGDLDYMWDFHAEHINMELWTTYLRDTFGITGKQDVISTFNVADQQYTCKVSQLTITSQSEISAVDVDHDTNTVTIRFG